MSFLRNIINKIKHATSPAEIETIPKTYPTSEEIYNEEDLRKMLSDAILKRSPSTENLVVRSHIDCYYIRCVCKIDISWTNGINKTSMATLIKPLLYEYNQTVPESHYKAALLPEMHRNYTPEVVLKACSVYSAVVPEGIPLTINAAKCIKFGECTIYGLAIKDLEDMDEVI